MRYTFKFFILEVVVEGVYQRSLKIRHKYKLYLVK
jgi:hypothetical protein